MFKKYIFLTLLIITLPYISRAESTIVMSNENYERKIDQSKLDFLSKLRGVVQDDIYDKIEKTQAVNPIKDYKKINIKKLNKMVNPIVKSDLENKSEDDISNLLSMPSNISDTQQISIWEYDNDKCKALLYFYKGKCAFIETNLDSFGEKYTNACLNLFRKSE